MKKTTKWIIGLVAAAGMIAITAIGAAASTATSNKGGWIEADLAAAQPTTTLNLVLIVAAIIVFSFIIKMLAKWWDK
jgi:hypothetical protein